MDLGASASAVQAGCFASAAEGTRPVAFREMMIAMIIITILLEKIHMRIIMIMIIAIIILSQYYY